MRNRTYGGVRGLRGWPLTLLDGAQEDDGGFVGWAARGVGIAHLWWSGFPLTGLFLALCLNFVTIQVKRGVFDEA